MLIKFFNNKVFLLASALMLGSTPVFAESPWDGKYNSTFPFQMSRASVCPKFLPIDIEVKIEKGQISGFMFNNGGGNKDSFCKLYHNGSITGSIDDAGNFINVKVKQKDSHSRKYSSYKITGNIKNNLNLISKSPKYHPTTAFLITKYADLESESKNVPQANTGNKTFINNNDNSIVQQIYVNNPSQAQKTLDEVQSSLNMYKAISKVVKKQTPDIRNSIIGPVNKEIKKLTQEKEALEKQFSNQFSTPIRPSNQKLNISSFKASETFPKIPFYVPGTNEIGEMLTIPRVTDEGFLVYRLDFLDPSSTYEKVRDSINIPHENIDGVIKALVNIDKWTKTAQENNLTRRVSKTAICIPAGRCQNKKKGIMSTEIVFQVYEDGSTAGRIQRNKGTYSVGYNLSVESSVLLSAYLTYMRDIGSKEFNIGNMSDDEVKSLFN